MTHYTGTARTPVMLALFALTATLVLAGCGEKEEEISGAADGVSTSPSPDTAVGAPSETIAPSSSPTPTTGPADQEPAADSVVGADCLPGNWIPHREEFATMMAGDATKVVTGIDGNMFLSIQPDGTVNTIYENWTYTFTVDTATVTIVKDGTDEGAYTVADDGSIEITDTNIGSTTNANMTIGGTKVAQVVEPQPSVFSLATITCSGDELTASVGSQVAVLGRER